MVELEWGEQLVDSLLEFGPDMPGPAGPVPVSFSEIQAWADMTRTEVPGWEAGLLKRLSKDYCSQYHKSRKPDCPMPDDKPTQDRRRSVASGFAKMVQGLKKANK